MKKYISPTYWFTLLLCAGIGVAGQVQAARVGSTKHHDGNRSSSVGTTAILVDDNATAQELAQALVGPNVVVSNATLVGDPSASGRFSGGSGILGFESGILLSTGRVMDVLGPNVNDDTTWEFGTSGDPDLDAISNSPTYDASVLEFDFIPNTRVMVFDYVFSSEEYNEYVNILFGDLFAFWVTTDLVNNNAENCAVLNALPVSIDTINNGNPFGTEPNSNPAFYRNNDLQDGGGSINTEMDGLTVVLRCEVQVIPGQINHIKLAIADASDALLDSAVFIQPNSSSPQQQVFPETASIVAPAGHEFVLPVNYTTSDLNSTLSGLELRVHFDSSKLEWVGYDSLFEFELDDNQTTPIPDDNDSDGDPNTDNFLELSWESTTGWSWSGGALPQRLADMRFRVAASLPNGDNSTIRFTAPKTAVDYGFLGTPALVTVNEPVLCDLDVDGNNAVEALTDGLLTIRHEFGFSGADLIDGAIAPSCTRCTAAEIESYLAQCDAAGLTDIDGNNSIEALTDGLLTIRYEFGFSGADLIDGAVAPSCTRCTAAEIEAYLDLMAP